MDTTGTDTGVTKIDSVWVALRGVGVVASVTCTVKLKLPGLLGVPVMIGVGATLDFMAGRMKRARQSRTFSKQRRLIWRDLGLLIGKGGLWGNTLRIKPPMIFSESDADFLLAVLDEALASV